MDFKAIKRKCVNLNYEDKLRLAQFLTQSAKQEAPHYDDDDESAGGYVDDVTFVKNRLRKLHPKKKPALMNSIRTMFQAHGGITDNEIEIIISELEDMDFLTVEENKILYP
jgi:hypothetical protein